MGMINTTSTSTRKVRRKKIENEHLCQQQAARCRMEGKGDVEIVLNCCEVRDVERICDEGKEQYGDIRGRSLCLIGKSKKWRANENSQ